MFGIFVSSYPAKSTVYTPHVRKYVGLARIAHTVYEHIFRDFPAKNTVHAPYINGSGPP